MHIFQSNKLLSSEYEAGEYKLFRYNLSRERIGGEAEKSDIDLPSICHLHIPSAPIIQYRRETHRKTPPLN